MLKERLKYKDYNDQDREVEVYFNLNEAEVVDIVAAAPEGLEKEIDDALKSNNAQIVLEFIKRFVHLSYGVKSLDGQRFDKNPEILASFIASPFYADFLLGLIQNDGKKGVEFIRGILPPKLVERAEQKVRGQETEPVESHYAPSARETFAQAQAAKESSTEIASAPLTAEERERAEFEAWKRSQAASQPVIPAPPHEQVG